MDAYQSLLWSYVLGTALLTPFWLIAGYQDLRRHDIDTKICLVIMVITAIRSLLFIGTGPFLVVLLLAYFTFREKEIALVGQADFMMLAHWITAPFTFSTGTMVMLVSSVIFLVCIIVYVILYRTPEGKRWHRGMMMPIVPPYAVSVSIMLLYQYPLSRTLFFLGW